MPTTDPATPGAPGDDALIGVTLGKRIRAARAERGLSMRALATAAEISQPFLSQIEGGQTMPSIVTLFRVAKVLGLSPSELLPALPEAEPEPDPVQLSRLSDARRVLVLEGDESATSRVISAGDAQSATVQEYRITRGPYEGEWFESDGELTVYVVEGEVTVMIEGRGEWTLGPGDALAHPGALRNRWATRGTGPATIVLVYAFDA